MALKMEEWRPAGVSIDRTAFNRLVDLANKSNPSLIQQLVDIFNEDCPTALKQIREEFQKSNYSQIFPIAHRLKSTASEVGALHLKNLAEKLEQASQNANAQDIESLLHETEQAYLSARNELQELANKN